MADIFELVGKMSIEGVDKATQDINGVTDTAKNSGGVFGSVGGKIAGAVAGAFATSAIIGFGKDVMATTQTFSDSMLKVQSLSGASGDELQKLNDTALEYGSTTAWTASQVADAMGYMALAGFDTNEIMDSLGGTLSLASASGTDLARASDILTDSMTAFGYSAKDANLFANVLATTQAKSNTTVDMLGEAFKYVAPLAGTYRYSVESVSTALGMMANAGIKGSMAGTAMASIITRLATDTNGACGTIKALGVEFYNADGSARDLSDVLMELSDATANLSAEEKAEVAVKVAGQEAQKGLLAILNQGSDAYAELQGTLESCDNSAGEMANTMESGVGGALRAMQSAIEGFKIKIGQKFEPYVTVAMQTLAKFVSGTLIPALDDVFDSFDTLIGIIKKVSPVVEVLTASFLAFQAGAMIQGVISGFQEAQLALALFSMETNGASLAQGLLNGQLTLGQTIVGLLTGKITLAELATGLWAKAQGGLNLIMSANPIGLFVMAIGTLVAIFVVAYNHSETFRNAIDNLVNKIFEFGSSVAQALQNFPETINGVMETLQGAFDSTIDFFTNLPENLAYLLGLVIGKIYNFGKDFAKWLGDTIQNVGTWSTDMKNKAHETAERFVQNMINFIRNLPQNLWEWLNETINKVIEFRENMIAKAKETAEKFKTTLIERLRSLPSDMATIGTNLVKGLWDGIGSTFNWLKGKITEFANRVIASFMEGFDEHSPSKIMMQVGAYLTQGLGIGIEEDDSAEKSIKSKVDDVLGLANDATKGMSVGIGFGSFVGDNPMLQYQLDFNAKVDSLNDGFERLIDLVGQYLPNIANGMDRNIVIDGNALAVGMSRRMDTQLGKIAVSKGRGNV